MFKSRAELQQVFEGAGIGKDDATRLADAAAPAVWLDTTVADESAIAIGATKIGGRPDLPPGTPWPERPAYADSHERTKMLRSQITNPKKSWSWATPEQQVAICKDAEARIQSIESAAKLSFLMQIDFAAMAQSLDADMPRAGLLSIFFDSVEQPWGFDPSDHDALAMIFSEDATLTRHELPTDFEKQRIVPLACALHPCITPPALGSAITASFAITDASRDALHELEMNEEGFGSSTGGTDWRCHRVGGWPNAIQGDMQTECALVAAGHSCGDAKAYKDPALAAVRTSATDWLMLAQLGSHSEANLDWGDNGCLYLWIRRDDLRARRFSEARAVLQCF